jgi:hypothetical protein
VSEIVNQRHSFAARAETERLTDWLIEQAKAEDYDRVYTFQELSDVAGVDVKAKRYILRSAQERARKRVGIEHGPVNGEGIKLLAPREIVDKGEHSRQAVRRKSTRALRSLACVQYDELAPEDQIRHNMLACTFGMFRLVTSRESTQRIEGAVAAEGSQIDFKKTLRLFEA